MWQYEYESETDETTLYWIGSDTEVSETVSGEITAWENGLPLDEAHQEAVAEMIQAAGTPERIRMEFDLHYGFERR